MHNTNNLPKTKTNDSSDYLKEAFNLFTIWGVSFFVCAGLPGKTPFDMGAWSLVLPVVSILTGNTFLIRITCLMCLFALPTAFLCQIHSGIFFVCTALSILTIPFTSINFFFNMGKWAE